MFVYVIVCSETLKIYIGQHKGTDLRKYLWQKFSHAKRQLNRRSHLFNAMRKYPHNSWSIHPLVSSITEKKELDETERLLIYALKAQHPDVGYNICDGGEGFTGPHTKEWKRKNSERMKGHAVSEETRRKIGKAYTGFTPARQSALTQNRPKHSPWLPKGRDAGFKHSAGTLANMRAAAAGRVITADAKIKMRDAKLGKPWSAARRAAQNKTFISISED
jgi:hypothetical protein